MRLLRHLLIPTALLAGTGAIAGAQICPGEDMYRFDNEVSFHGFVDKHFDLAIQAGFTQYDSFYLTVEPRSDVTLRFETTVGLDLTIMLRRNGSQFAFGDTEATGLFEANCVNDSDEPSLVYVDITYFDGTGDPDCADYSMQVVHVPDCGTDDIRENDDSCFSSTQLVGLDPGVEHWQISQPGDDDWFGAWLAPGQSLDFSTFCADTVADLDLRLYRAGGTGCGTLLAESATSASNESLSYVNTSSVAEFVAAEVRWAGSAQGAGCAFYSFNYELGTVCGAADIMEPNNDLCSAVSLTEGVIDGASVHPSDPDFYVFQPAFEYTAIFAV